MFDVNKKKISKWRSLSGGRVAFELFSVEEAYSLLVFFFSRWKEKGSVEREKARAEVGKKVIRPWKLVKRTVG